MDKGSNKSRRQFLKNTSIASLSLAIFPNPIKASSRQVQEASPNCVPVTLDYYGEGPFYTENPPDMVAGKLAAADEPGTKMIITGRVSNLDCTEFIPDAVIDVWHANDAGEYDNEGYTLRGRTTTNSQGFYVIQTIHPGKYLNGNSYRPSHIHFKITTPGFETLTTQLYFEGDPYIEEDAAASIKEGAFDARQRIIPLSTNAEGVEEGTWNIVVDGQGVVGVNHLHVEKGMVYKTYPNPFQDKLEIQYGVFKPAQVSLLVFNMNGQIVSTLEERELPSGKYSAVWIPQSALPSGFYFVALKINEMQVHYQKVLLQK